METGTYLAPPVLGGSEPDLNNSSLGPLSKTEYMFSRGVLPVPPTLAKPNGRGSDNCSISTGASRLSGQAVSKRRRSNAMRINFSSTDFPKAAAKRLSKETGSSLSDCQKALARSCGYHDWHDLHVITSASQAEEAHVPLNLLADIVRAVAQHLGVGAGDVQYALLSRPLNRATALSLEDHLYLRALTFRGMEIPEPSRRGPGAVVRQKRGGRLLIVRGHHSGALLISNRHVNTGVATFEYSLPRERVPLFIPRRLFLPYGAWTEGDGATVLFARDYIPLWRVRAGGAAQRLSPSERINYIKQEWFFTDGETPWDDDVRYEALLERLWQYGVRGLPKLVEILPSLVHDTGMKGVRSAVEEVSGSDIPA